MSHVTAKPIFMICTLISISLIAIQCGGGGGDEGPIPKQKDGE